jgi:hypothetical protein
MRSLLELIRSALEDLGEFLRDPVGYVQELRVRRRRHKLVMVYAKEARVRHGLGPGISPLLYAYDRLYREGLATPTEDGLEWHWPEGSS